MFPIHSTWCKLVVNKILRIFKQTFIKKPRKYSNQQICPQGSDLHFIPNLIDENDSSFNIMSNQENQKNLKDVPVSKKPQLHINFDQEIKQ